MNIIASALIVGALIAPIARTPALATPLSRANVVRKRGAGHQDRERNDHPTTAGKANVLKSQAQFQDGADSKLITAPGGKPFGAAGVIVNCPVVAFASKRP